METDIRRWFQLFFRPEFWSKFRADAIRIFLKNSVWNFHKNSNQKTSWHHLISVFIYYTGICLAKICKFQKNSRSTLIPSFSGISKWLPSTFLCKKILEDDFSCFSDRNSGGNFKQTPSEYSWRILFRISTRIPVGKSDDIIWYLFSSNTQECAWQTFGNSRKTRDQSWKTH